MGDIVNPYANPYLPAFVSNRPRIGEMTSAMNAVPNMGLGGAVYSQIHPVKGFEGADAYAATLAAGSSEILTESDAGMARIYVVAKDANGQSFVQGFDLVGVERPKPVTMDDLAAMVKQALERIDRIELGGERSENSHVQSHYGSVDKGQKQSHDTRPAPNSRNGSGGAESSGGYSANGAK